MKVSSIEGGKKQGCEVVDGFLQMYIELKKDGCDEEFIKHAMTCLSSVYISLYSSAPIVYSNEV